MSRTCPFCNSRVPAAAEQCPGCGAHLGSALEASGRGRIGSTVDQGDTLARVAQLVSQGKKLEAMKVYREVSGVSLAEAKAAVEAIADAAAGGISSAASQEAAAGPIDDAFEAELVALLRGGQWITAIKLYGERTGSQLRESKAFIDALAVRHGLRPTPSGCGGVIAVLVIVAIIGAIVAFAVFFGLAS